MDTGIQHDCQADELLAIRCQLGEASAFDELVRRWADPLWRHAMHLCGDAHSADDLTQEIWLAVLQGMARLRDPRRLRSWLFAIAHRVLVDRLRAQYARAGDDGLESADALTVDFEGDRASEQHRVNRGLALLPLLERDVLSLFYLQGLSLGEIADAQAVPIGTVKSRLYRARGMLRARLDHQEATS